MKKWVYLLSGVVIGALITTSGSAFAAQVKSLIGQKVTGEVSVVVNGQKLNAKGAIVDNITNVPARAITDALGGKINLSGNTVTITTPQNENSTPSSSASNSSNPYLGYSKSSLLELKASLQDNILTPTKENKAKDEEKLKLAVAANDEKAIANITEEIARLDADLTKYQAQLDQVNEALAQAK